MLWLLSLDQCSPIAAIPPLSPPPPRWLQSIIMTRFTHYFDFPLYFPAVLFGLLSIGLAFLASRLGTLVTIINSVLGIFGAPILGAFLVGMLWRRAVPR